jgi:hypothetical protein
MPLNVSSAKVRVNMLAKSLLLALVFCLTANAAAKQAPSGGNGKLAGMVSDPVGVYVPGARIVIEGKRLKRELWSGDDGTYSVDLPPGTYSVRFSHPGFVSVRKRVRIKRDAVAKQDVVFHIDPKNTVTVYEMRTAGAPLTTSIDGRHNNGMHPTGMSVDVMRKIGCLSQSFPAGDAGR